MPKRFSIRSTAILIIAAVAFFSLPRFITAALAADLTDEALRFGHLQVAHMLRNRPEMRRLVQDDDAVFSWCARQFAGEFTGREYCWVNAPKTQFKGYIGCHDFDEMQKMGWIFSSEELSDGSQRVGEYQWATVIFELFNTRNDRVFKSLWELAAIGMIDKDEFVTEYSKLEFASMKEVSKFYTSVWRPEHPESPASNRYWYTDAPSTYAEWLVSNPATKDYLHRYSLDYDRVIVPILKRDKITPSRQVQLIGDF